MHGTKRTIFPIVAAVSAPQLLQISKLVYVVHVYLCWDSSKLHDIQSGTNPCVAGDELGIVPLGLIETQFSNISVRMLVEEQISF